MACVPPAGDKDGMLYRLLKFTSIETRFNEVSRDFSAILLEIKKLSKMTGADEKNLEY